VAVAILFGNLVEIRGIRVIRAYLASSTARLSSGAENRWKLFDRYFWTDVLLSFAFEAYN